MCNTCILWQIHFDIWQNQYNIVKLKNKKKKKNLTDKQKLEFRTIKLPLLTRLKEILWVKKEKPRIRNEKIIKLKM